MVIHRIKYLFICFLIIFSFPLTAQSERELKNFFYEAESYFLFEEYKDALPLYQRILKNQPDNFNVRYRIGRCYLADEFQSNKAEEYLEDVVGHISEDYREGSYKEKNAPFESLFYLGDAYMINYKLDEALKYYRNFLELMDENVYDRELVEKRIKSTEYAKKQVANPQFYFARNLGDYINTRFLEMNPIVSGDGNTIVFTRKLQFYDAVFISRNINGTWTNPINLTPEFGLDGNSYATGLSYNGDEIFVYRSDQYDGNIYASKLNGDRWGVLKLLNNNINTKYWESHASVTADGKYLYFTSNRKGGYGGLDIYVSEKENGEWGEAINLGAGINTPFNEESPFLTEDMLWLYFSSQGHENMGGYDIFKTHRLSNGEWSEPENIGYPINTTHDDLFFSPVKKGEYAYYALYRDDSYGLNDIYHLEIFSNIHPRTFNVEGLLSFSNAVTQELKDKIQVVIREYNSGNVLSASKLDGDTFNTQLTQGNYTFSVEGPGIQNTSEVVKIPVDHPDKEVNFNKSINTVKQPDGVSEKEIIKYRPPILVVPFDSIVVSDTNELNIDIKLEKGVDLTINHFKNNALISSRKYKPQEKLFKYIFKPLEGTNKLKVFVEDSVGNISHNDMIIIFNLPKIEIVKHEPVLYSEVEILLRFLKENGSVALVRALSNLDVTAMNNAVEVYVALTKKAELGLVDQEELDRLFSIYYAYKNIDRYYNELLVASKGNLELTINSLNIKENEFKDPEQVVDYLLRDQHNKLYNDYDLLYAFANIIAYANDSASLLEFYSLLLAESEGGLKEYLNKLDVNKDNFNTPHQLLMRIYDDAAVNNYTTEDLMKLLTAISKRYKSDELYYDLLYFSDEVFFSYLYNLTPDYYADIRSVELLYKLLNNAYINDYSRNDVITTLNQARENELNYKLVKKILLINSDGALNAYIQRSNAGIVNSVGFHGYVSRIFHDTSDSTYNEKDVVLMLLKTSGIDETSIFIESFKQHANSSLAEFVGNLNARKFKSPIDFVNYLFKKTKSESFTHSDVMNTLIKIAYLNIIHLVNNPDQIKSVPNKSNNCIYAYLTGILALLIILIIILFRRRKKK